MLEFLRDSLLCSTEDSPKNEVPKRHSSRYAVCCGGGSQPRRRAEIISSQGEPKLPQKEAAPPHGPGVSGKPSGDQMASARTRTPSPLRTRANGGNGRGLSPLRSGSGSFLSTSSFHSNFGSSVPFSAAAMGSGDMCRGGLYVPVQRGLGPRTSQRDGLGLRGEASVRNRKEERYVRCGNRVSVPLKKYRPLPEDPLDVAFARSAEGLSKTARGDLLVKRLGQGEYEVEGKIVRLRLLGQDVVVYTQSLGTSEMLDAFLRRMGEKYKNGNAPVAKAAASFDLGDPASRGNPRCASQLGSANGSFMLRNGEGSFLYNRSEAASFTASMNGSFYGNHGLNTTASMVHSPLGPPRQQRLHRQTPSASSSAVFASRGANVNVCFQEGTGGGGGGAASRTLSPATAGFTATGAERSPSGRLAIGLPQGRPGLSMNTGHVMPQSPYSKQQQQQQQHQQHHGGLPPHGVTPPMPNVIRPQQGYPGGRVFACTSPPAGGQPFPPPPMVGGGGMGPPTPVATVKVAVGSANREEGQEGGSAPERHHTRQQQQQHQQQQQQQKQQHQMAQTPGAAAVPPPAGGAIGRPAPAIVYAPRYITAGGA